MYRPTKQNKLTKEKLLMKYAGIFPNDIEEVAKRIAKKRKLKINYSR